MHNDETIYAKGNLSRCFYFSKWYCNEFLEILRPCSYCVTIVCDVRVWMGCNWQLKISQKQKWLVNWSEIITDGWEITNKPQKRPASCWVSEDRICNPHQGATPKPPSLNYPPITSLCKRKRGGVGYILQYGDQFQPCPKFVP